MYRRVLLLAVAAALSAGSLLIACSPDDTDAAATPTATPGGEADTPTPDVSTSTPSPEATPSAVPRDTDGDGLNDADEVRYGTHPGVADTDGDGFSDKEEVDNWDRRGGNHLRFNPLVADVPRLQARSLGAPVIQLYATTEESSTVRKGMTDENSSEVQVTTSRGRTNVHQIEEQHAVGVNAEVRKSGPITTGKVSASYDYQHTDTTTQTNYWDQTTVETNRQASSQYFETINSETVTTKGGEIKVVMGLLNDGDVSYTVNNMELAAYMEDPRQPGSLIAVGTLRHDGPLAFTPDPLGPAADPDSAAFTPFTFGYRAEDNPEEISRVLESADQLVLEPTNLSLTGSRPDVDLNLASQNIRARTAEVIIDFGDHDGLATERYRVAIDRGGEQDLSLDDLMGEVLDFDYTFSTGRFPGMSESHQGLTSVRTVAMNSDTNSYWLAAHTFRPPGSAPGTEETTLYNILSDDYQASDIRLGKGDVLHLVYITDTDLDGLSDRLERLNGTRLDDADSDGDGLDDALETYGWLTNLSGPPCDDDDALTLVVSNPLQPDSDGDGIVDSEEMASCANPMGELAVHAGEDRVASADEVVTLAASPSNYLDSGALRYRWTQTGGPSVGQLPASPRITFSSPQEVTSLFFEATVTDTQQNGQSATDSVRVLVARDKDRSVFVDADSGHDFNNSGATPDDALATLERALASRFGGADVYLRTPTAGAYTPTQTLVVDSGASLYGGFGADWSRDHEGSRTPVHVSQPVALEARDFSDLRLSGLSIEAAAPPVGSKNSFAVHASDGGRLLLDNVTVQGSDLALSAEVASNGSTDFVSASSFGVFATRLDRLDVVDSTIRAGRGADGPKGTPGANGATGDSGSNGGVNGGGRGGDGNGNGAAGGRGGDGATKVVTCASGSGGSKGGNGAGGVTGGGGGSPGRADADVFTCSIGSGGSGGAATSRASSGNAGTPAEIGAQFPDRLYLPTHGTAGTKGGGGAGGGGGGGGAGANFRDGGGGGGGGEGGDGGGGGAGGRGAGGSFAIALNDVSFASIAGSVLQSGDGGSGGPGGTGGRGGAGGSGGRGGNVSNNDARDGGRGGSGGPGGHGGNGGGGAGGPVAGLLLLGDTVAEVSDSQIRTGDAGAGREPNAGRGGWNYGVFEDAGSNYRPDADVTYELGTAGNSAPPPGEIAP